MKANIRNRRLVIVCVLLSGLTTSLGAGLAEAAYKYESFLGRWRIDYSVKLDDNYSAKPDNKLSTDWRVCGTSEYFANNTVQTKGEMIISRNESEDYFGYWSKFEYFDVSKVEVTNNKEILTTLTTQTKLIEFYLLIDGQRKNEGVLGDEHKAAYQDAYSQMRKFAEEYARIGEVEEYEILELSETRIKQTGLDDEGNKIIFELRKTLKIEDTCDE